MPKRRPRQEKAGAADGVFKDEPQARALYDKMIEAFRQPQTLSYKSDYRWSGRGGQELGHCTYTAWLKKPNQFRVEGVSAGGEEARPSSGTGRPSGSSGPGDRPHFSSEDDETYNKTRSNVYMKKPAPPGGHSIGHEVGLLGVGMSMPVLDPSTFYGYTDSLQPYLDGVMGMGRRRSATRSATSIEVSIMKHQRSWYLWLSPKDHLPRKLKQVVRVSYDIVAQEVWSDIVIDGAHAGGEVRLDPAGGMAAVAVAQAGGGAPEAGDVGAGFRVCPWRMGRRSSCRTFGTR